MGWESGGGQGNQCWMQVGVASALYHRGPVCKKSTEQVSEHPVGEGGMPSIHPPFDPGVTMGVFITLGSPGILGRAGGG